jgi:amino acid adenylation domain-containing protein
VGLTTQVRAVFESASLADLASTLTSGAHEQVEVPPNLIPEGCEAITAEMLPLIELTSEHIERIVSSVPGGAANIQDIYPLAPLQEGILFHHLLSGAAGDAYIRPMLFAVSSQQRLEELIVALQGVIDRHDMLRTAVLWEELPQPAQVVYRRANLPVEQVTLDQDRDPIEQAKAWLEPNRQRMDLRYAPLMRMQIASDPNSERWYVLLQMHHIAGDNVAQGILIGEIAAYLQGRAEELPASIPYRNHVAQILAYARTHDAEGFFRSKLGDIDEPTAPFGLMEVHGDGSEIEEAHEPLELSLAQRIRAQVRRLGVSAATLFHAAWGLVVARTSGREDVVFGSVLLGRMQGSAGGQRILGMFINTLPLRLKLQAVTAKELIEQTQRELIELLTHEQASLAVAQRCSGILGTAPLFTALLNYRQIASEVEGGWSGAEGVELLAATGRTNYPITLSIDDLGEGFALTAETDRRIDARRLNGYLQAALASLMDALEQAPQTHALSLSILPASERRQLLELFNATRAEYPQEKLIHELFEEQVERTPDAIAVVYEGQSLTYGELNAKANQLAHYLRERGVGPDQLVGICVGRSVEMVIGLLGILKAGGAYVPLDPNYPPQRLAYMLEDAKPRALITQRKNVAVVPSSSAARILVDQWHALAEYPSGNVDGQRIQLRAEHLAYVIYTSGSTGRPKGVMVEHRNLLNYLNWAGRRYEEAEADGSIVSSSLSFDATVTSLYLPLLSGQTVRLIPEGDEIEGLERLLREGYRHSLLKISPAHLTLLGQRFESYPGHCKVNAFVIGGEALSPATVELWQRVNGRIRLINEYGPTETVVRSLSAAIWSCWRASSGEMTTVGPGIRLAGIW